MTRRELVATLIAAVFVLLSMYQCGAKSQERALKKTALASLDTSKAERARLLGTLRSERSAHVITQQDRARWRAQSNAFAAKSAANAKIGDSLRHEVAELAQQLPDTASVVPRPWFDRAMQAADRFARAAEEAEAARRILADSLARSDSIAQERLLTAVDSVEAHLKREADRAAVIRTAVRIGSDRCGWGPWELMPCVTRKVAFVGGVVGGAVAAKNGPGIVRFLKGQL